MAAKVFYVKSFLLLLFNLISSDAIERTFSDIKRCADEECSMLLCRGKAVRDFTGPDCRFLSFKKSETIHVYYKLSGQRTDMWAGGIGARFGYFPKDLLAVNHIYTDKELEVKAEETDFVCFDTGYNEFDNYDIDSLLDSSLLMGKNDNEEDTDTIDQTETAQGISDEAEPSTEEATETESHEDHDDPQDFDKVPGDSLPQLDETRESLTTDAVETDAGTEPEPAEYVVEEEGEREQLTTRDLALGSDDSEQNDTKDTPTKPEDEPLSKDHDDSGNATDSFSEGKPVPDLKTSLGETFDAVTTDDEDTWKITPYEEEESEELEDHSDDLDSETRLLAFSEEKTADTPESDPLNEVDPSPSTTRGNDQQASDDKNIWTSFGDTVFAIVSGGERTADVLSSEEDEDEEGIVAEDEEGIVAEDEEGIVAEDEEGIVAEGEEDEDEEGIVSEDEEGIVSENPQSTEEPKAEEAQMQADEPSKEPKASEKSVFDDDNDDDDDDDDDEGDDMAGRGNGQDQTSTLPADDQNSYKKTEEGTAAQKLVSRDDSPADPQLHTLESKTLDKPIQEQASKESAFQDDNAHGHGKNTFDRHREESISNSGGNKMMHSHQELPVEDIIPKKDLPREEEKSKQFKSHGEQNDNTNTFKQFLKHSITDIEKSKRKHSHQEPPFVEAEIKEHTFDEEDEEEGEVEGEEEEELLEDENAVLSTRTETDIPSLETSRPSTPEPEYSDSVLRLTLLREHFEEEDMERLQSVLGLKNLFKAEAMFSGLDVELQTARHSQIGTAEDIEKSLEAILEASETPIMDEIEKMLDGRDPKNADLHQVDNNMFDEEAAVLDDLQELAFSLRQKYSTASDSVPLAADSPSHIKKDGHVSDDDDGDDDEEEEGVVSDTLEYKYDSSLTKGTERNVNLTAVDVEEKKPSKREEEPSVLGEVHKRPDISLEEDGGHFNRNKDNQPSFPAADEMQKVPQAILEKPFDVGLGVEMEHSSSGSLDSMEPVSDLHEEEEWGLLSSGMFYTVCLLVMSKRKIVEWAILMISLLPDEYKPGETFFGCPWQAVVVTAFVGVITFILFFWRTVLAVKKREYLVDENGLTAQMKALMKEKSDAISKTSELQKQTEVLKEKQRRSEETTTCALQRNQDLESKVLDAETRNKQIAEEKSSYVRRFEEERANSLKNGNRIEKLEKSNEKLLLSRKKTQEALSKTTVLLDEAKIREDARNVQRKCLERDHAAAKEENKAQKIALKEWEDKHKELSEQIKVYQKSQKELEDSVILKDNNVEVLSDLLADLDACDLQKSETRVLANGEVAADKKTFIKNRIKQMMDVSRVQTTLAVVEEERDRFMNRLLNEEKARKTLEEQHQELEHAIGTLKSERNHVDNQFTILKQKNEIMTEMYQQKENALQQRLTKEELERRSKETLLSEVGGKALEAEEQVKVLRQRINEMEEQMKKTEEVYKEQIKEQENKTHSNWVNARNAERALNQEKGETSKLREKLAVITSQLNERRAPLFRPNSGQPLAPRQGDSYGPSPVSGGAPSPPPMMEAPRRPPSAPVGRRIDPYGGSRPPSDPHGRYLDNKHNSGLDMMAPPRTSSPAQMDGMTTPVDTETEADTQAEASTESPEPSPGSFLASPIRDSPGPMVHGPATGPGHNDPLPHPGPHGHMPPPGPHRGPVQPLYHPPGPPLLPPTHPHGHPLPANGHPGMLPPGPMGGEQFGPRPPNGHAFRPRPGPGHPGMDLRGPLPPHFRPPPPHMYGPMHPPPGVRGPMGLRPPFPPDMRFPGPRGHAYPPHHLPPGAGPPLPPHGHAFAEVPQNSSVPHPGAGQRQDFPMQQEAAAAPQDSVNPAMAEP